MNYLKKYGAASLLLTASLFSCEEKEVIDAATPSIEETVPSNVISQLSKFGYDTDNIPVYAHTMDGHEGYVVENDIFLTTEQVNNLPKSTLLSGVNDAPEAEQYRTINLVESLPRTLTVYLDPNFGNGFGQAFDEALRRYNAEGLRLSFRRVNTSRADIRFFSFNQPPRNGSITLGISGGFPTRGNPANTIQINVNPAALNGQTIQGMATIMAHEIGHAIGFRHTDFFDRSLSCGGRRNNEGQAGVGAIQISGTPSGTDRGSFMQACAGGNGTNRPFSRFDRIALDATY